MNRPPGNLDLFPPSRIWLGAQNEPTRRSNDVSSWPMAEMPAAGRRVRLLGYTCRGAVALVKREMFHIRPLCEC